MRWRLAMLALLCASLQAEDWSKWRYYRAVQFNTSASGAGIARDVKNFPVALALNESNFDFQQARKDGYDLRFAGTRDGARLPHSIEHWDPAARSALVWVKVPLVRADSTSQQILMKWGNAAATNVGDSKSVFDNRDGFVGVWHLNDEGSTAEGAYKDSTGTAAHATGVNVAVDSRPEGRIGKGLALAYGRSQWVELADDKRKRFDITERLTFSIWAKATSYQNAGNKETKALPGYETMFAKGDNSWRLQKFGIRSWHKPPAELIEICVEKAPREDLCVVGKTDVVTGKWFHFTGVHDHPHVRLYVNGVLDKEEKFDFPWTSGDHPVGIGNQSQFPDRGRQWDGVLDEARVISAVKDEHWIKLDYESQREGQRFITFGSPRRRR